MPYYTQKPFRVEIVEVTESNINNIFTWVSSSDLINAHSLSNTSFTMQMLTNPPVTVEVGSFVIRRTDRSFGIIPADSVELKMRALSDEEAMTVGTIANTTWTRFSEIVF